MCRSSNYVVGIQNKLPWYYSYELKLFREITKRYKHVLMGYNTYKSIPNGLKDRICHVATNNIRAHGTTSKYARYPVHFTAEIPTGLSKGIIIGGPKTITKCANLIDKLYLSIIHEEYEGDSFFNEQDIFNLNLIKSKEYLNFTHKEYECTNKTNT